jgi:hypothetical protein
MRNPTAPSQVRAFSATAIPEVRTFPVRSPESWFPTPFRPLVFTSEIAQDDATPELPAALTPRLLKD